MEPIFGKDGGVVGWMVPPDGIADLTGRYVAFVVDGAVFDYRCHYLGRLHNGYLWDRDGNAVASLVGAAGGPPVKRSGTIPSPPSASPAPPRPKKLPAPPRAPAYTKKWSEMRWGEFLSGRQKFIAYRR